MKPGDLVKHKRNKTVHLVTAVREIKGRVAFFHLEGFSPQRVFYSDDVRMINEARWCGKDYRLGPATSPTVATYGSCPFRA